MKEKGNIEDWREIAKKAYEARNKLFELHNESKIYISKKELKSIDEAIKSLDKFRSNAEDRMFKNRVKGASIHVFYGDDD